MKTLTTLTFSLLCCIPLHAQAIGAIASGNWNNPSIWTSNSIPNASNDVYIGSNDFPSGSVPVATVTLTQNQFAHDVWLGYQGGSGSLDLSNFTLTANSLNISQGGSGNLTRSSGAFQVANLSISQFTLVMNPNDTVTSLVNLFLNGSITNEGVLNNVDWQAFLSSATLHNGNDTLKTIYLQGSQINVSDVAGQTTGLTVSDFHTSALFLSSDSKLVLDINGQGPDWIFRWQNPVSGNHITDLNNLIASGRITFNNPTNSAFLIYSSGDGYTYIANAVPEPSSIFLLAAGCLCGLGYRYYRNRTGKQTDAEELLL